MTSSESLEDKHLAEAGPISDNISEKKIGEIHSEDDLYAKVQRATAELDIDLTHEEMEFVMLKVGEKTWQESIELLKEAVEYHQDDVNLDYADFLKMKRLSEGPEASPNLSLEDYQFTVRFEATIVSDWSPYAEVRASTSMLDDPNEPAETLRMYIVGILFCNCGALVATFFGNRYPSITLNFLALQLIIYPAGKFLEYVLPDWGFKWGGKRYSLNPGPWSFKEQTLSTQMMSSVDGVPFAFRVLTVQRATQFFNETWAGNYGYMALLSLCASFTGYGIAGMLRGLLVYPVRCVWYSVLPLLSMNRSLTKPEDNSVVHGWKIKRFPFLLLFTLVSFCWYWFPEFVFTALSYFTWITWISPNNVKLSAITGAFSGLGLNPISTFDWSTIGGTGMVSPWYSTYVAYVGQFVGFIVIVGIYFSKSYYTQYLPINTSGVYDNTGASYDVNLVLTADGKFNETAYNDYSPAFLTAGALVNYGASFAVFPASIVYGILWYRRQLVASVKSAWQSVFKGSNAARRVYTDPFTRNLENHPEVPEWWFAVTLVLSLVLYIIMVEVFPHTETPVWSVFFAIAMNMVFIVPIALLYAQTNTFIEIGLFIQILIGYMIPHNANAMMITQCIANNFWEQAQNYITNQKQTHYARIPSRALFRVQYMGTFITIWTCMGLLKWEFTGIKDYCDPKQSQKFTCATTRSSFASYVLWGTLGPKLYLNGLYTVLKYSFLIGVFVPIPFYFLEKWQYGVFRRFNSLVLLYGCSSWAPSNFYYTTGNLWVGWFFNYYLRRNYFSWWKRYNYILYAALGTGVAWAAIIVFFSTGYNHVATIDWWGNSVYANTADYNALPLEQLPDVGYFGPAPGHFPQP